MTMDKVTVKLLIEDYKPLASIIIIIIYYYYY